MNNQTEATLGATGGESVAPVVRQTGVAADELWRVHASEKRLAVDVFAERFVASVRDRIGDRIEGLPYTTTRLYGDEAPESRIIPETLDRLAEAHGKFVNRAAKIHRLANEMGEGDDDSKTTYDHKYWDMIRLQRSATLSAAYLLAVEVLALAYTCEQFGSSKHLWRNDPVAPAVTQEEQP